MSAATETSELSRVKLRTRRQWDERDLQSDHLTRWSAGKLVTENRCQNSGHEMDIYLSDVCPIHPRTLTGNG